MKKVVLIVGIAIGVSMLGIVVYVMIYGSEISATLAEQERQDSIARAVTDSTIKAEEEAHATRMKTDRKYRDSVNAAQKAAEKAVEDELKRTNPSAFVDVTARWKKGGFGTVALATVTIKNGSLKTMSDAIVKFTFTTESGNTIVGTRTETIGRVWKPGQTKTSEEINLGFIDKQAASMSCELVNAIWEDPE